MPRRPLLCLCLLTLVLSGLPRPGGAAVVPSDSLAVLGWAPGPEEARAPAALRAELAALPWDEAAKALESLLGYLATRDEATPVRGVARTLRALLTEAAPLEGLMTACPEVAAALDGNRLPLPARGFALVAGVPERAGWFAAAGGLALVARFDSAGQARVDALMGALADCEGLAHQPMAGERSDIRLDVYRLGGLLAVAVGRTADVVVLSANPQRARALLERAADDPQAALLPAMAGADFGGAALDLDFAALGGLLAPGPDAAPAEARLAAALGTLGRYQARMGATDRGIASRGRLQVNPAGGDASLRDLLLCRDCAVTPEVAGPADSVQVTSHHVDLAGWVDYADEWVRVASGGEQTLRSWLAREHDLELDAALLDWAGDEVHRVLLAPLDSRLGSLVWLPPQALVMPVADGEAARRGMDALATALGGVSLEALMAETTGQSVDVPGGGQWARSRDRYRDVPVTTLHAGPFASAAWAVVDGQLILATPARAMEPMLDAVLDGQRPTGLAVRPDVPASAHSIARLDGAATYRGLEELFAVMAQPAAYFTALALEMGAGAQGAQAPYGQTEVGPLAGRVTLPEGASSVTVDGTLSPAAAQGRDFRLQGLRPGMPVTVEMTSERFDTYLYLIDVEAGGIVRENDDAPDTRRSAITFWPRQGAEYWVRVGSYGDAGAGPYRLRAAPAEPTGDLPTTAGRLDLSDGPASLSGNLASGNRPLLYRLSGVAGRREVSVALASNAFDTYLYLIDPVTGAVLAENDDAPDTTRSALDFVAEPGREYWLRVDSYQSTGSGTFTLSASTGPAGSADPEVLQPVPTGDIEPRMLAVGGEPATGRLGAAEGAAVHRDFALEGAAPGARLQVDLEAGAFDTYLYLVDAASGAFLMENDDHAGSLDRSRLTFEVRPERDYVVRVGSFGGAGTGPFRLQVTRVASAGAAASAARAEPPTFGELLPLYQLLPAATGIVAGHLAPGGGFGVVDGDTLVSEFLTPWRGN